MDIYDFLALHDIAFQRVDHPAVFTCEEAQRLVPQLDAHDTKNLFAKERKSGRLFLIIVHCATSVDLGRLAKDLGFKGFSLAPAEILKRTLGVDPGSVTVLGLANDQPATCEVLIDEALWRPTASGRDAWAVHPLINTATLVIGRGDIQRLLGITGHLFRIMDLPRRDG